MKLAEKLVKMYTLVDHVDKAGKNKTQNYNYVRSADVTHAVRRELATLGVYAEINFEFIGAPYTIPRAKEPNAPFSAVNVRCYGVLHDSETNETLTFSGVGSGADTGDKAAYKAQTGALKYALRSAFLVPDEAAPDAEADESVDDGALPEPDEAPSFQDARQAPSHAQSRPTQAPAAKPVATGAPAAAATIPQSSGATDVAAPSTATVAQVADSTPPLDDDGTLPNEEEMKAFGKKFRALGDKLTTDGKLKTSRNLPVERKLLAFLLHITKADKAALITKAQWEDFFQRVDAKTAEDNGLVELGKLINKINGVEEKKK